jgi:hypothetical protein
VNVHVVYVVLKEGNYVSLPPQGSWRQIERSGFDSLRYQNFWDIVGLEQGSLSLMSTIEELVARKSSGSGLENQDYGLRDQPHWPRDTLNPQKWAPTLLTSSSHSVGIVRSWTKSTKLLLLCYDVPLNWWYQPTALRGITVWLIHVV